MGLRLSDGQIRKYHEQGYLAPIRALSAAEALACRRRLEAHEAATGGPLAQQMKHKTHLIFTWLDALVRDSRVLDPVEDLIGPDILCYSSSFFTKEARDPAYVSWHQDLTYWGLEPADIVTAWIAFSPSTLESGAMRVVPGSHRAEILPHHDTFAADNLLSRGQEIAVEIDEDAAVDLVLQPGEMSLHHVKLAHSSPPNRSGDRRIGFAVRYAAPNVRQVVGERDSAMLVRGSDRFGNFEAELPPAADLDPAALERHARITSRQHAVLYRGTEKDTFR